MNTELVKLEDDVESLVPNHSGFSECLIAIDTSESKGLTPQKTKDIINVTECYVSLKDGDIMDLRNDPILDSILGVLIGFLFSIALLTFIGKFK